MKLIYINLFASSSMFQVKLRLESGEYMYMSYDYYKRYYAGVR